MNKHNINGVEWTEEQIRVAIAKKCGWRKIYEGPEPDNRWMSPPPNEEYASDEDIPDYLNSLDAITEAEDLTLSGLALNEYADFLIESYGNKAVYLSSLQRATNLIQFLNLKP